MRSKRSLVSTCLAGTFLALTIATGASPVLRPVERHVVASYRSVVRIYDQARRWGVILRWSVDPEYAVPARPVRTETRPGEKTEDVCQALPASTAIQTK